MRESRANSSTFLAIIAIFGAATHTTSIPYFMDWIPQMVHRWILDHAYNLAWGQLCEQGTISEDIRSRPRLV